jgi:hypothetical protein
VTSILKKNIKIYVKLENEDEKIEILKNYSKYSEFVKKTKIALGDRLLQASEN